MQAVWRSALAAGAAAAILGSTAVPAWPLWSDRTEPPGMSGPGKAEKARTVIAGWPSFSALAARAMIEQYGLPDEVDAQYLAWSSNGPWRRTVVHRTARFPFSSQDVLEQSVPYAVAQGRWHALAGFGHGVAYDPARGELSCRSASEETNFLALNLAADIAQGRLHPEEADRIYSRTVAESLAGKYSRYMRGLLFAPAPAAPGWDWRRGRL